MSPEAWLKASIEAATTVPAYPLIAPEGGVPPYVVYARESTNRDVMMPTAFPRALAPSGQFTIEVYAATYQQAKELAYAVAAAVHNFTGTAYGATIMHSLLVDERDGDPVFFDGQDRPTFVVMQTLDIRWQE